MSKRLRLKMVKLNIFILAMGLFMVWSNKHSLVYSSKCVEEVENKDKVNARLRKLTWQGTLSLLP